MGTSASEPIRVEGVVRAGGRVEVELRVGGVRVARAADGDRLTVATAGGEVAVDASALALDGVPAETHRGSWTELARRPEAGLVAARSPAPHVACELVVRRVGVGASLAMEAVVTEQGFDEGATHRAAVGRTVRAVRAVRLASAPTVRPDRAPRPWWVIPWAIAGIAALASGLVIALAPNVQAALVSASTTLAILVAARFAHRAIVGPPAMDHGLANPFPRFFACAARSLPRFAPEAKDASRLVASFFGPVVVLGWGYIVFLAGLWPIGVVAGDIDPGDLSPVGTAGLVAGLAVALAGLALGYLLADRSELPRVRSLLSALEGGNWRARRGVVAAGAQDELAHRSITIESDGSSEGPTFSARSTEGGVERLQILAGERVIGVERDSAVWASDDWTSGPRTMRMRVRAGARALVAGFDDGADGLAARGPASLMLWVTRTDDPELVLLRALRWRLADGAAAGAAAVLAGIAAWLIRAL